MNALAARALGPAGVDAAASSAELVPELRALVAEGVVRSGEVLRFAGHSDRPGEPPGGFEDLTGWECFASCLHLDEVVPVEIGSSGDGQPVISEEDQALMLRHGLRLALEIVRLVDEQAEPVAVRCIIGASSTNGTFRFHRVRQGESWLAADLDTYLLEKLIVVDGSRGRERPTGNGC